MAKKGTIHFLEQPVLSLLIRYNFVSYPEDLLGGGAYSSTTTPDDWADKIIRFQVTILRWNSVLLDVLMACQSSWVI